jgi:hypothetical protein
VLLPIVLWVSYHVYRSRGSPALLYPYFAWLAAVGTFLSPVSNDYNLFFLPVAALAVWDRRDQVLVHLMMALLLLWWQPLLLPIGGGLVFGFKIGGVCAVALCICARCREQGRIASGQDQALDFSAGPSFAAAVA